MFTFYLEILHHRLHAIDLPTIKLTIHGMPTNYSVIRLCKFKMCGLLYEPTLEQQHHDHMQLIDNMIEQPYRLSSMKRPQIAPHQN